MKVLCTTSRMPFAVDEIRKLGEQGHEVFAADTFRTAPGSHSAEVHERVVVPAPKQDTLRSSARSPTWHVRERHRPDRADVRGGLLPRQAPRPAPELDHAVLPAVRDVGEGARQGDVPRVVRRDRCAGAEDRRRLVAPTSCSPPSREFPQYFARAAYSAAASSCSRTPGRWPEQLRSTTSRRPSTTRGWCRASSRARTCAASASCTTDGSPRTARTSTRARSSTPVASSSCRSTSRARWSWPSRSPTRPATPARSRSTGWCTTTGRSASSSATRGPPTA